MVVTAQTKTTIRDDGSLELSSEERDALGVEPGDGVLKVTTDQGIMMIMTPRQYIDWVFDQVGEGLPEGMTLEELIDAGRETRGDISRERYAISPSE